MDDETFERIPWEHLSTGPPLGNPRRPLWLPYVLGGAVVLGVLVMMMRPPAATPVTTLAVATTAPAAPTTTSSLLSEAALMALPGVSQEAAAWAEWLTEIYLTADGSPQTELAALLPPGSALPAPAPGEKVFVESAHAVAVAEEGSSYRALVVARLLGAAESGPYQRLADRALLWTLRWEPEGWIVVDLPEAAPMRPPGAGSALPEAEVPEPILSAAAQLGAVHGGGPVGDLWRVVISTSDELGGSWPVVVWFAPDGSPVG